MRNAKEQGQDKLLPPNGEEPAPGAMRHTLRIRYKLSVYEGSTLYSIPSIRLRKTA